jgi:hypothetical protein
MKQAHESLGEVMEQGKTCFTLAKQVQLGLLFDIELLLREQEDTRTSSLAYYFCSLSTSTLLIKTVTSGESLPKRAKIATCPVK